MSIDAHAHIGNFEPVVRGEHSADDLVRLWDASDVEAGMISVLRREDMTAANDRTQAAHEAHPDRIFGFAYLNPHDLDTALGEVERRAGDETFRGVKLHSANDVYFPFQEAYFPLYERIEALRLPILWHTGTYPYSNPLQVAVVARQFPGVPFILAHFGLADSSWECFPAAELADNVYVDTAGNPIIPVLDEWIERFGAERMLWGSDHPFYSVPYERLKVDHLGCSSADKARIATENARRLFGI